MLKKVGVLVLAAWAVAALAGTLDGKVVQVIDGQTVVLQTAPGKTVRVQLAGIVAPEICQPWGPESRDALKDFVAELQVRVADTAPERGGVVVGELMLDKVDIGSRMVEEGHAWSVRTKWDRGPWVKQERVAKALRRGLHGVAGVVAPGPGPRQKLCP